MMKVRYQVTTFDSFQNKIMKKLAKAKIIEVLSHKVHKDQKTEKPMAVTMQIRSNRIIRWIILHIVMKYFITEIGKQRKQRFYEYLGFKEVRA